MIILGLTGSIGMGKSTISGMFADAGVPVWDADAQVHQGYEGAGEEEDRLYSAILNNFPEACTKARVDRKIIADIVFRDPPKLRILERLFGHYLEMAMVKFIADMRWREEKVPFVVLDVPLLFESKHFVRQCDYVAVAYCTAEEQRNRVLARPGMTEERFASILKNQIPSGEKVKNADIRINTSLPLLEVRHRVADIIENICDEKWAANQMFDENGLFLR